ncbi:hypothetical protein [Microbacterium panaciterrae]|uniref:Uncharacterized protein n=1 Tax=Microbacterium panaciterrae TaxID=985759 RepID=A0ABP8PBE1_9MICO
MVRADLVRVVWGLWQLTGATVIARAQLDDRPDAVTTWAIRALGVRQILQGVILSATGSRTAHRAGGVIDLLHASSMLVVAIADPRRHVAALIDGSTATCFAVAELRR